VQKWWELN